MTFDYPDRTLFLKRVEHPNLDANNFDRTGMKLIIGDRGFEVMNVGPGTPASDAGLQNGDVVTRIAGRDVMRQPLRDTRWMLKQIPVGKPVSITFRRGVEVRTTALIPRELVPR